MTDTTDGRHLADAGFRRGPETLPAFGSEEEAREFWVVHDSAAYWDQLEDVTAFPPSSPGEGPPWDATETGVHGTGEDSDVV